jgi:hypothetical protein
MIDKILPFSIFRGRTILDMVGLLALVLLFTGNAFHFEIHETYSFYREQFGILFLVLSFWYLLIRARALGLNSLRMNRALFFLLLFPFMLIIWSSVDPGVPLYGEAGMGGTTDKLGASVGFTLYVLRNALLYLPMVLYVYLRGLNRQEIRIIALAVILVAPFSISAYLESEEIATLATMGLLGETGGVGVAYNTYVPFLTFSALCGIYLLFSRTNFFIKLIVLLCLAIVVIFCLLSTSRQSVLYIIATLGTFLCLTNQGSRSKGRWLNLAFVLLISLVAFNYIIEGYDLGDKFLDRFGHVDGFIDDDGGRLDMAIKGLLMLNPLQWFTGAGLTSIINSGPHNDYVRWSQRVGIPLMAIGFMPFIIAFRASFRMALLSRTENTLAIFITLAVGFTLFHSFFGYPREDANQALAVYLGLAIWFGSVREGLFMSTSKAIEQ